MAGPQKASKSASMQIHCAEFKHSQELANELEWNSGLQYFISAEHHTKPDL